MSMIDHDDIDRLNAQARERAAAAPRSKPADDRIPSPQELAIARRVDHSARIQDVVRDLVRQLRDSPKLTATARDVPEVIRGAAEAMAAKGWRYRIDKGGARDAGATDALAIYPPCGECSGHGDVTVGPPGDDTRRPCRGCGGKGYVA